MGTIATRVNRHGAQLAPNHGVVQSSASPDTTPIRPIITCNIIYSPSHSPRANRAGNSQPASQINRSTTNNQQQLPNGQREARDDDTVPTLWFTRGHVNSEWAKIAHSQSSDRPTAFRDIASSI
jgi:hypothetical protein